MRKATQYNAIRRAGAAAARLLAGAAALTAAVVLVAACSQPTSPITGDAAGAGGSAGRGGNGDSVDISKKTDTVLKRIRHAMSTGDQADLDRYLMSEDPVGRLRKIVDSRVAIPSGGSTAELRSMHRRLPPARTATQPVLGGQWANLQDGDILLVGGSDSAQAALLGLAFHFAYGHAGVVATVGGKQMLISATATDDAGRATFAGVRREPLPEVAASGTSFARIRPNASLATGWSGRFDALFNDSTTEYAFLDWNLEPITLADPINWYCSKVVDRIYSDYGGGTDVQDTNYYFGTDATWKRQRTALLYQVYKWYYNYALPASQKTATLSPDNKLQRVLRVLVTPDEIRASFSSSNADIVMWGPGSALTEAQWKQLGTP